MVVRIIGDNAGDCTVAATGSEPPSLQKDVGDSTVAATGSTPPSLQEDHIKDISLINE